MRTIFVFAIALLSSCTAADVQTPTRLDTESDAEVWQFDDHADELRAASCPSDLQYLRAQSIDIRVIEAERGPSNARDRLIGGMMLAGAWQLKSGEANFGGLSGLDVLKSGSLLAVSDAGAFVGIGIDASTGAPDGLGSISYMRGVDGNYFANKRDGDSEGLSVRDGLAFVSFEQDHRISAFDLERCGSAARAANVVELAPVIGGKILSNNRGPEGFTMLGDTLSVGFEFRKSGGSPFGIVNQDGSLSELQYTRQPDQYVMTGMDARDGITARIFRAYDPIRGPRVILQVDRDGERVGEADLKQPLPVDNFEGVAIGKAPSGQTRIWVVSDDNFNPNQRTLLLALDLHP